MSLDELLKAMLRSFFVITAGIVTSIYVFCLIFNPEAVFSVDDIGRILIMALVGDLPFIIFYSPKELSKRRMLVRMAAHSLVLLSILLFFAQLWDWISLNNPKEVVVFILSILVIYIAVFAANSFRDKKLADKLNEKLQKRYHSQE